VGDLNAQRSRRHLGACCNDILPTNVRSRETTIGATLMSVMVVQNLPRERSSRLSLCCMIVLGAITLALAACQSRVVEPTHSAASPTPGSTVSPTPTRSLWATLSPAAPPEPCAPPCWYGIIPGETSYDEALKIIASLPFVKDIRTREDDRSTWIFWNANADSGSPSQSDGGVETEGDLVTFTLIEPFPRYPEPCVARPAPKLTAGDVVKQYGPPEVAWPTFTGVEVIYFEVGLWYPERGVAFYASGTFDPNRECLYQDSPIYRGEFTIPMTLDEYIDYRFSPSYRGEFADELVPWPGFGCSDRFGE
jgi:hypothetical protein